jgi:L-fuconolactonase
MTLHQPARMIDTHQHLWMLSERSYSWLTPDGGALYRDFGPQEVAAEIAAAGVTGTVLVQAADTYDDTVYMLSVAAQPNTVIGVVGWVPLDRPDEAAFALDLYAHAPALRGIRALNHDYADTSWLLRDDVNRGIELLAPRGLSLDVVSVRPEHLDSIEKLARRHPQLTVVIDHLAKPDIAGRGWEPWASQMTDAAAHPNVVVKLSGLGTSSGVGWTYSDWQPYVDHVITQFGSDRVMLGSDWPVATLAGDFVGVWQAQREVIAALSADEQDDILFRTAERVYSLPITKGTGS